MYKMATAGVPSGTILAVHLQKCSHLSNEIRVIEKNLHRKTFTIYFLTFTGKIVYDYKNLHITELEDTRQ
jgi:hypothetical protein